MELFDPDDLIFPPIVARPACETHRLSNLIDILLKPYIQKVKSYIRDDIDFLSHIPTTVPQGSLLVSFDVVNLYTNMSHELGLPAVTFWYKIIHTRIYKNNSRK